MKDERNHHHSTVDESFSEQRPIRIVDANYILCEKIGPVHVAEWGLTAGGRRNTGEFGIFKNSLYIERFDFCFVNHHYCSRNAFQVFFG